MGATQLTGTGDIADTAARLLQRVKVIVVRDMGQVNDSDVQVMRCAVFYPLLKVD